MSLELRRTFMGDGINTGYDPNLDWPRYTKNKTDLERDPIQTEDLKLKEKITNLNPFQTTPNFGGNNIAVNNLSEINSNSNTPVNSAWGAVNAAPLIRLPGGGVMPNPQGMAGLALGQVPDSAPAAELKTPEVLKAEGIINQHNSIYRDKAEAVNGMLDGQLDAATFDGKDYRGNTFIKHKDASGKEYIAFKSDLNGEGDIRYGMRAIDSDGAFEKDSKWIMPDDSIKTKLNTAHTERMNDIKKHGGIENYNNAEKLRAEIGRIQDLKGTDGEPLILSNEAKASLNEITKKLDEVRTSEAKSNPLPPENPPSQCKGDFDRILSENRALRDALVNSRASKVSDPSAQKEIASELGKLNRIETTAAELNGKIDTAVDHSRDEKQNVSDAEKAKLAQDIEKLKNQPLSLAPPPGTSISKERESLTKAAENLRKLYGNGENPTKYMLDEAKYLNERFAALTKSEASKEQATEPTPPNPDNALPGDIPAEALTPPPLEDTSKPTPELPPSISNPDPVSKAQEVKGPNGKFGKLSTLPATRDPWTAIDLHWGTTHGTEGIKEDSKIKSARGSNGNFYFYDADKNLIGVKMHGKRASNEPGSAPAVAPEWDLSKLVDWQWKERVKN
jgi:hypothetical protein